ncbi:MAG: ABC transporter ATP-binding protein [Pseudonocardia sp.]|nr:ABC transporter ATP-binding protein [Pseudonocardia sp.]
MTSPSLAFSDMTSGWHLVRATLRTQRGQVIRLLGWSALETSPSLTAGWLLGAALDRGFLAHNFLTGVFFLGIFALTVGIGSIGARQALPALGKFVEELRYDLVQQVVRAILLRGVGGEAIGGRDVEAATKHTETFRLLFSQLLLIARLAVFSLAFTMIGLFVVAPVVAWFAVAGAVMVIIVLICTARGWRRRVRESLLAEERLSEHAARTLGGLRDVVALGAADRAERDLTTDVNRHARAANAIGRVVASRIVLITVGARLPITVLLLTAPFAVSSDVLTAGQLLAAATYLIGGIEPTLRALVVIAGDVGLNAGVLLERVLFYSRPPAASERAASVPAPRRRPPTSLSTANVSRSHGRALALRGVTFGYSATSERVLDGVDLDIRPGERLAVVGPSGVGKSTMANLLVGLERPQSGTVTIGGVDASMLHPWTLRRLITLLPQEAYIFAGSVRENLAYLHPSATDEELIDACRAVGAGKLLNELGGIDATIGSVAQLSEGQKQIITLARAYATPSQVVVLDEATCHLHPEQERRAEDAFGATGRTIVVIAHRMSSAIRADRVVLLHGGLLEVGTHEELVVRSPLYADLVGHWNVGHWNNEV